MRRFLGLQQVQSKVGAAYQRLQTLVTGQRASRACGKLNRDCERQSTACIEGQPQKFLHNVTSIADGGALNH